VLNCNRSSTYRTSCFAAKDEDILSKIQTIKLSNPHYGLRRLKTCLKIEYDTVINIKKLRRICRSNNIIAKTRKKQPPKRDIKLEDTSQEHPNLIKDIFKIKYIHNKGELDKYGNPKLLRTQQLTDQDLKPNQIWASDFTYLPYHNQNYYLGTTIDIFTKEITGFHLSTVHSTALIIKTLEQAIKHFDPPQIIHSDQGSEYRSQEYQQLLESKNIQCSMSAKSSPWQNGFQESFYNNFKLELEFHSLPKNLNYAQIYNYIANQIDYYNNHRIHTTIENIPAKHRQNYYISNKVKNQNENQNENLTKTRNKEPKLEENFVLQEWGA
jgi:transposase InsO family protein